MAIKRSDISLNKKSKVWTDFFGLSDADDIEFEGESVSQLLDIVTTHDKKGFPIREQALKREDMKIFCSEKIVILTKNNGDKLLYYVEFFPGIIITVNEAANEGTAMENFVTDKFKLPAFSIYNAANMEMSLRQLKIDMSHMKSQATSGYLVAQGVCLGEDQRLLFKPFKNEYKTSIKIVKMLLEEMFAGKYRVCSNLDDALKFILEKMKSAKAQP